MEGLKEGTQPSIPPPSTDLSQSLFNVIDEILHSASTTTPPSELADEDLRAKILRQVEFYFSDANLPTDDFLMKIIHRPNNPPGWVPIKTIASFHKMKKLTKNIPTIVAALRTSTELEVSPEGHRVRRLHPLPDVDFSEIRSRTVVTWNLPEKPTIEYVIDLFSTAGAVEMARIRKTDHPEPLLTRGLKTEVGKSLRDCYALIEYKSREDAIKAVEKLNDESNWRSGLRVKLLQPLPVVPAVVAPAEKERMAKNTQSRLVDTSTSSVDEVVLKERPTPAWARSGQTSFEKKQEIKNPPPSSVATASSGAGSTTNVIANQVVGTTEENSAAVIRVSSSENVHQKQQQQQQQQQQPRMPDAGNLGFGLGRGSIPSSLIKLLKSTSLDGSGSCGASTAIAPGSLIDNREDKNEPEN